jgi:hypothetical protein
MQNLKIGQRIKICHPSGNIIGDVLLKDYETYFIRVIKSSSSYWNVGQMFYYTGIPQLEITLIEEVILEEIIEETSSKEEISYDFLIN